ncbi:MAG: putative DNA binding domain-containing protein [Caldilineaceae bacterium]
MRKKRQVNNRSGSSAATAVTNGSNKTLSQNNQPQTKPQRRWYKADLHIHTLASNDYEEPNVSYLDCVRTAVEKGMEIIAVTDHNTVAGVAAIRREVEWLARLERENRLTESERQTLDEWRDLANKVLILPGFEFTATFGFHILAIFSPETSVRQLEHVLLALRVPEEKLDVGSTETGASTDVLTAYKIIREAGGLVIAAHANSTHGVAMRDFPFGGQTKIAYTQDPNLDALEVTDLEHRGHSTVRFFNGSKPEYSRRMHCLQGSDAHRLHGDPKNPKRLGIGERATELMLDEASYEALCTLLRSTQFDRVRPVRPKDKPFDPLLAAREEGPSIVQSFHESAQQRGGKFDAILNDICAFANTAGGTVFVGAGLKKDGPKGLARPKQVEEQVLTVLTTRLTPQIEVKSDLMQSDGATVLRLRVAKGNDRPYCLDGNKFYLRDESETYLAVRDEIVALVKETLTGAGAAAPKNAEPVTSKQTETGRGPRRDRSRAGYSKNSSSSDSNEVSTIEAPVPIATTPGVVNTEDAFYLPQNGVEIVDSEVRNGNKFHSVRDLRNSNIVHNVTRRGARNLWNYAIQRHEDTVVNPALVQWQGDIGLIHVEKRAGRLRYDLALREGENLRIFYGVTDDGMEGHWATFIQDE